MNRKLRSIVGTPLRSYWVVFIVTLYLSGFIFTPVHGAEHESELEPAINAVVMLTGTLDDVSRFGAGIIIGRRNDSLYIATANHLVRRGKQKISNIKVRLKAYPEILLDAVLLNGHRTDLDLAVLEVIGLSANGIDVTAIDLHILARTDSLNSESRVFPVGNPDNRPWGRPVAPAPGFEREGNTFTFESILTRSGHSGGGLIDESGALVGMVMSAAPTHGYARDIQVVIEVLEKLGIPIGLKPAYAYQIAGKWKGNSLFPHIDFQVDGIRVKGEIGMKYPRRYNSITNVYSSNSLTETKITRISRNTAEFDGEIRGNLLFLEVRGHWIKEEQTILAYPSTSAGMPIYTKIDFKVNLKGHAQQDQIRFRYNFEYPAMQEQQEGVFTAIRVREPEKKTWQLILKEVLETEMELTRE